MRHSPAHRRSCSKSRQSLARATSMSNSTNQLNIDTERYEFCSPSQHQFDLARRDFFKILGSGIAVFAITKDAAALQETAPGPRIQSPQMPKEITSWLHI